MKSEYLYLRITKVIDYEGIGPSFEGIDVFWISIRLNKFTAY